jgi:hypothetical protein
MSLKQEVPRGGVQSWLKEEDEQLGKLVKELIAKTGPDKLVKVPGALAEPPEPASPEGRVVREGGGDLPGRAS